VTAAAGSFGSSADWPGLVLASSHLRRRHFSPLHDFCLFFRPVFWEDRIWVTPNAAVFVAAQDTPDCFALQIDK